MLVLSASYVLPHIIRKNNPNMLHDPLQEINHGGAGGLWAELVDNRACMFIVLGKYALGTRAEDDGGEDEQQLQDLEFVFCQECNFVFFSLHLNILNLEIVFCLGVSK